MTKADLVEEVSRITEMPFHEARAIVEVVVKALGNGERVELRGFGTFGIRRRRARRARNPRTGDTVEVPEKVIATFNLRHLLAGLRGIAQETAVDRLAVVRAVRIGVQTRSANRTISLSVRETP